MEVYPFARIASFYGFQVYEDNISITKAGESSIQYPPTHSPPHSNYPSPSAYPARSSNYHRFSPVAGAEGRGRVCEDRGGDGGIGGDGGSGSVLLLRLKMTSYIGHNRVQTRQDGDWTRRNAMNFQEP
jgi:hypothetical protein